MHHLVGNNEEAEDLAQEVFLRVYRGAQELSAAGQVLDLAVHHRQQPGPERPAEPRSASRWCRSMSATPARSARGPPSSWSATASSSPANGCSSRSSRTSSSKP